MPIQHALAPPRVAIYNRPKARAAFYQLVLVAALAWLGYEFILNAKANLDAQNIASGFGFLDNTAGFGVNQSLIPYDESDTYGRVFFVGLFNTLLVAGVGIVLATILGFVIGIARLSRNWLLARLAEAYVELIRNLPLLFQILFWYLAVLGTLPGPRQSISLFGEIFLNNRGIIFPAPLAGKGAGGVIAVFALSVMATLSLRLWATRLQVRTGRQLPLFWTCLALLTVPTAIALIATGFPIGLERPELRGFNFVGGIRLLPEFVALLVALVTYTAAFIAEIVRACSVAWPERGRFCTRSAAEIDAATHHRAASATRDRAAAHQSVSQPDQELLACGGCRISRPVRRLRRHDIAPDRPSHRNHRHHHGRLSCHFAHHQCLDELVQRPYPNSGALMAATSQQSYIRGALVEPEPPPAASVDMLTRTRARLFGGVFNTVLTVLSAALVVALVWPTLKFLFIDAVWTGSSRVDCLPETAGHEVGACWPFVKAKLGQLMYGFYPASERWRANLTYALGAILLGPLLIPSAPLKGLNAILFFVGFPIVAFFLLVGGVLGLPHVETRVWGGLLVTLVISFTGIIFSLPLGVLLALGRRSELPLLRTICVVFIEFWRGVPLITVLFFATYMLPFFLPNAWRLDGLARVLIGVVLFAAAYMAEVVRGGLQAIPRGQFEGAMALGLGYWEMMGFVILPQALRLVIPGIVNSFIALFKDTTLVLIVAIFDLLGQLRAAFADPSWATPVTLFTGFAFAGVIYFVVSFGMSRYALFVERRLSIDRRH